MQVRLGEWDASATTESLPTQETGVSSVLVHPRYYAPGVFYDLAILVLDYRAECDKLVLPAGAGHGCQHPCSQHRAGLPPLCRLGGGHCTVLYFIVLYFTVLYFTVLNCTVLYCTVLQVGDTYVTDQCLVIGWGKAGGAQWCQQQSLHFIHYPHNRTDRYGRRGRAHAWLFDIGRQHQVQN